MLPLPVGKVEMRHEDACEALIEGLAAITAGDARFLHTRVGERFQDALLTHVAPAVEAAAVHGFGWDFSRIEAFNFMLVKLHTCTDNVRSKISSANDPIAYAITCATKQPDFASPVTSDRIPGWLAHESDRINRDSTPSLDELDIDIVARQRPDVDSALERISDAMIAALMPYTPPRLHRTVDDAVRWLSRWWPESRSHEQDWMNSTVERSRRRQAELAFPLLSKQQVAAIDNLVWGGLPDPKATSLFYASAAARVAHMKGTRESPRFDPAASRRHVRALTVYGQRMRRHQRFVPRAAA